MFPTIFAGSQSPYIIIQKTVMEYTILKGTPNILPRGTLILKYTIKKTPINSSQAFTIKISFYYEIVNTGI
jgi:hypothetical protein